MSSGVVPLALMHHHVVTIKQPMADRQNTIECAGKKEEDDQAELYVDDHPVIPIDKLGYCGHDKTSFGFLLSLPIWLSGKPLPALGTVRISDKRILSSGVICHYPNG